MFKIDKNEIAQTIEAHGIAYTLSVCMEEPAELIQAVSKVMRNFTDAKESQIMTSEEYDNLVEEMADTLIAIEELKSVMKITDDEINGWIEHKQKRQNERDKK